MTSSFPSSPGAPLSGPRPTVVALAGTTAGSYRLERRLGAGGMGEVWLGRHVVSDGLGAVKLLSPRVSSRADATELFTREQRALLRLSHPHIVPVFEVGQRHIAMAYVDGASLARRLRSGMAPGEIFRIGRQVASALAHAHARRVLHLDVKPSNVLLDAAGNAFLADFGAAHLLDDHAEVQGIVFGTPSYIAPERATGSVVSEAADQYALGRTILSALLGAERLPPWGEEGSVLPASLPRAAREVLLRSVAVNPAERFPSLAAFEQALASCPVDGLEAKRARLEPVREEVPFTWAGRPDDAHEAAPNIVEARYTLDSLERAHALPPDALATFRGKSGLRTTGFTLYAHTSALGDAPDASWLARARHLVVLVPGYVNVRGSWTELALALVRDNPDTIVAAVDHSSFGDSAFVKSPAPVERVTYAAVARTILAWTDLLGLEPLPTVFVGHSMAATGFLIIPDDEIGAHRARIALTPVLSRIFTKHRAGVGMRAMFALLSAILLIPGLCRMMTLFFQLIYPAARDLTPAMRASIVDEIVKLPVGMHARMGRALAAAISEGREPLRRAYIAVGATDPEAAPAACERATQILGFRPERFRTLASGGHFPHLESVSNPEGTLRNRHEILLLVDEAIDEVSPARRTSTEMAETVAAEETPISAPRESASMAG